METKLIQLEDGTLVEVEVTAGQAQPISGGLASKVNSTLDKIYPLLISTCRPIASALNSLKTDTEITQAEVQVGLSFENEGNVYIAKAKTGANLTVKLTLKPKILN
jgi:hypothetical protein